MREAKLRALVQRVSQAAVDVEGEREVLALVNDGPVTLMLDS